MKMPEKYLDDSALELARWQGRTDAHMAENSRRLDGINGSVERIELDVASIRIEVTALKTKIAFWSAVGGLAGAAVVSGVVAAVAGGF